VIEGAMTLTFELSEPLRRFGATLREWSVAEVRPYAREADERHAPPDNWRDIVDSCPVSLGRSGNRQATPQPDFAEGKWIRDLVVTENLNYGDHWISNVTGTGIGHLVVRLMGTAEQVERWYRPIVRDGGQTAFGLTEPGFGSDTSMVTTTATRDGDTWVLNGTKMYCTYGGKADYVVVFASVDRSLGPSAIKAFVVPRGTPGFRVGKMNEDKMGIRSWLTSELVFDGCAVPLDHQLGWTGDRAEPARSERGEAKTSSGRGGALGALAQNKPNIAALGVAMARASVDVAAPLLRAQRASFAPHRWAIVENDLAAMRAALDRIRRVNFQAQWLMDQGRNNKTEASMSKAYGPPTCERVIRRCIELLGPDGTSQDLLLEKWYRDVKILDIFEGSGQVQRIIVGRTLMGQDAGRG
jgi:acyl-CoA dehydrogenase